MIVDTALEVATLLLNCFYAFSPHARRHVCELSPFRKEIGKEIVRGTRQLWVAVSFRKDQSKRFAYTTQPRSSLLLYLFFRGFRGSPLGTFWLMRFRLPSLFAFPFCCFRLRIKVVNTLFFKVQHNRFLINSSNLPVNTYCTAETYFFLPKTGWRWPYKCFSLEWRWRAVYLGTIFGCHN